MRRGTHFSCSGCKKLNVATVPLLGVASDAMKYMGYIGVTHISGSQEARHLHLPSAGSPMPPTIIAIMKLYEPLTPKRRQYCQIIAITKVLPKHGTCQKC